MTAVGTLGSTAKFIEQLRTSNLAFIEHFHRPHMEDEDTVPDFHIVIANRMLSADPPRFACAVPREHAKTTIAKLMVVKAILFEDYRFPLYVSDTHDVASSACKDIWAYLLSDEYTMLTGEKPMISSVQLSRGTYEFRMRWFPEGFSAEQRFYKTVNILAKGAGQQIRGTNKAHSRPDFLVLDDVETEEIVNSEELYKKYEKWVYGPVFKALRAKKHRIVQIGNLISHQSLLLKHMNNEYWTSMRFGAIKQDGKTPLWPELWSPARLKQNYDEYAMIGQLGTWFAEMMNLPYDPESSLVDVGKITFLPRPDPADDTIVAAWVNIDPAISKKNTADRCAIVASIMYDTGLVQHVEVVARQGMDFRDIYEQARAMAERWHTNVIFCEDDAFQAVLLPVFEMLNGLDGAEFFFYGVSTGGVAKIARLRGWAGTLHKGETCLTYGDSAITGELSNYDRTKKENADDVIDACSQLNVVLRQYFGVIMESRVVAVKAMTGDTTVIEGTLI